MSAFLIQERYRVLASEDPSLSLARVVSQEKGLYRLLTESGEETATVAGHLRYEAASASDLPAVGDYVMVQSEGGSAVIRRLLSRRSLFLRKAAGTDRREQVVAADIDTVFLCMALASDFNLRRLERYLSAAWESGALPVVVLTKADLAPDAAALCAEAEKTAPGVNVIVTSSLSEDGYRAILPYLKPGLTVAFVGSSGVGKSTLINRLAGEERQKTGDVQSGGRGRHTTTRRELFYLPCGTAVIDTPGMRELGMWGTEEGVSSAFADVEALAARCRFRDCTHHGEPGCAVRAAIGGGTLSPERLRSYEKLKAENDYAEDAAGYLDKKEAHFKEIAKINKARRR